MIETEIDQIEYEHLTHDRVGILPIRYYPPEKLISILEELGMEPLDYHVFHVAPQNHSNKPLKADIDDHVNSSDELKRIYGRDMLLTLRKIL